jgi:FkbH-like protein
VNELASVVAGPTAANYLAAARALRSGESPTGLRPLRAWFARSYTVEPVVPYLEVEAALAGVRLELNTGDFGTFRQDILDPSSALYAADPDVVIVAVQTEDLVPELCRGFLTRGVDEIRDAREAAIREIRSLALALRGRSSATLLLHTIVPPVPAAGLADGRLRPGQGEVFEELNRGIWRVADEVNGVEVFDLAAHVAMVGRDRWEDQRYGLIARAPLASRGLPSLARSWSRVLALIAGVRRKCVVLDLDDTLWGGVLGEEGPQGVLIGSEYPGSGFLAFQRALLDLHSRGVLLAIASKNDADQVDEVFRSRPEMLLRSEHFAARRINWNDKATNLQEIADELSLGLDALVFIDDSATERALVAHSHPEILVPEWPRSPAEYRTALEAITGLDTLRITADDHARNAQYADEAKRNQLRGASRSLDDFYAELDLEADFRLATPHDDARIAQLCAKTNQFNMTLRRYRLAEVSRLRAAPDHEVHVLRIRDRFGDSGQVGVAILRYVGEDALIDVLLMSCRVLGRGVETFLIAAICAAATARGARRAVGEFVSGPRNGMAAHFYERSGFTRDVPDGLWVLDLAAGSVAPPAWIRTATVESAR